MSLRPLPAGRVLKALKALGFEATRQKGSHVFLQHADGRRTVVPVHKGEEIGRGLLRKIIRDTKVSVTEFLEFV